MNSKFLRIALSFATVLAMSGCSIDDLTGEDDDEPSISDPDKVELAAEYSNCVGGYGPWTEKAGADGKFVVECSGGYPEIAFARGVTSVTISDGTSEETIELESKDFDIEAEVTTDYGKGTSHFIGKHSEEGSFDCTYTYESQLPLTASDAEDLDDKMDIEDWPEVKNNCPSWMDEDDEEWSPTSFKSVENIELTHPDGKKSNITFYESFEE